MILRGDLTLNLTSLPLKVTRNTFEKPDPQMTTLPPPRLPGVDPMILGLTSKLLELAIPAGVNTLILPPVAQFGTTAMIWLSAAIVNVACVWLNTTRVVPARAEPVITTRVPAIPLVG